jgi:hypothetical protein
LQLAAVAWHAVHLNAVAGEAAAGVGPLQYQHQVTLCHPCSLLAVLLLAVYGSNHDHDHQQYQPDEARCLEMTNWDVQHCC